MVFFIDYYSWDRRWNRLERGQKGDGTEDKGALSAQSVYKTLIHEILDSSSDGNAAHRIAFAELELGRNLLSHAELSGDDLLTEIVFYL